MKPHIENGNTSGPNFSDGEEAENMSWSLSITNVPNDVYDDQTTKVSSFSLGNSLLKLLLLLLLKLMALNVFESYDLYLHVFVSKFLKQLLVSFLGRISQGCH